MGRITVRLPESLHSSLTERADREGVSLNQLLVYALTNAVAGDPVREQRERFDALVSRVPPDRAEAALASLLSTREASAKPSRTASPTRRRGQNGS